MDWKKFSDVLIFRTWWSYTASSTPSVEVPYHVFNLFEGTVWLVLSCLVLQRFIGFRRSKIEILYATAFFTFGLTDYREAYVLQSWLIWLKAANLLLLFWLRAHVIKHYYPETKLY